MNALLKELLLVRSVRKMVGLARYYYFVKVARKLKSSGSEDAIDRTVSHNLRSLRLFGLKRMNLLIRPLSVMENVKRDARMLVIGPRNEDDILNLAGHGFDSSKITGLDLISYSPRIEIGDMHQMKFPDSAFDVLICGWTLSYSNAPLKFASEALRVTRDGGIIAIGVEYSTLTEEEAVVHQGYHLKTDGFERINSSGQVLGLFSGHVRHVYFNHDAPNRISHTDKATEKVSNVAVIFSIKK